MPDITAHPSAQALSLFSQGRLSEAQAKTVAAHLETCLACRQAVAAAAPDTFMGKVRAAKPSSSSLPPNWPGAAANPAGAAPPGAAAPADVPPELANHPKFRILREVGRGGMGVIYLAEHRVLEKQVALKVISPALLDNPDALNRFHAEAKAAARLYHPNIAIAHDADQAGGLHFLVMEYVEGQSLAQLLEKRGPLPVAHACHYVRQAAQGLQHAAEREMVHRDIKPHNLMLTSKGQVKILDFGLARMRGEQKASPRQTQLGAFMGTPEYVAPEQAVDAREADIRADVYSLGCTLYALLAGRPPFVGDTPYMLALAHVQQEARPLPELRPDLPAELWAVVAKMLAKKPEQRYQQPVEVAQALVPFIKAGLKPAAGGAPATSKAVPAGTGTRLSGGTSKLQGLRAAVGGNAAAGAAPAKDEAANPFEGLEDEAAPRKKSKLARALLAGVVAAVLVLGLGALLFGVIVVKLPTKDGVLVVEVNEPNAELYVDGAIVTGDWSNGGKRAEVRVKPGARKLEVKKDGFIVAGKDLTFREGDRQVFTATLLPNQPAKKEGVLVIEVNEANPDLYVDGKKGPVTWAEGGKKAEVRVAPDKKHRLEAKKEGFKDFTKEIEVEAGGRKSVAVRLDPLRSLDNGEQANKAAADKPPPPLADKDGFKPLFNGKDLTGWNISGDRQAWQAQDAVITGIRRDWGPTGLYYNRVFGDFHLRLETMLAEGNSSAIQFRQGSTGWYIVQVEGTNAVPGRHTGDLGFSTKGLTAPMPTPLAQANPVIPLKPGEWFRVEIVAIGAKITVLVEGKVVVTFEDEGRRFSSGAIHLVCRGKSKVHFRKIEIKELSAPPQPGSPGLNGQDRHKAEAAAREAVRRNPDSPSAHGNLGNVLLDKGQLDEAITEYRKVIRLKKGSSEAHNNLGIALARKGRLDEAIAEYQEALRLKPDFAPTHNDLGIALGAKGRLDEAIAEYRRAIALAPDYAEPHCNLGFILQKQNKFREALEELRRGHELGSKLPGWKYPSARWVRECERLVK
jgi:Tfp pilus assembly protein PilF/tRNA A-37 threonylcarbamoyl transferase component Bud32